MNDKIRLLKIFFLFVLLLAIALYIYDIRNNESKRYSLEYIPVDIYIEDDVYSIHQEYIEVIKDKGGIILYDTFEGSETSQNIGVVIYTSFRIPDRSEQIYMTISKNPRTEGKTYVRISTLSH